MFVKTIGYLVILKCFLALLQETQKFRTELWNKLLKDEETFGDDLDNVVEVCAEVFLVLKPKYR